MEEFFVLILMPALINNANPPDYRTPASNHKVNLLVQILNPMGGKKNNLFLDWQNLPYLVYIFHVGMTC